MPRIHTAAPPAPVPPATVAAARRPHASRTSIEGATTHAAATAAPAASAAPDAVNAPVSRAYSASIGGEAVATLSRLRPLADVLAAIGQCVADLDRWLANGFVLQTYRTPDGHRFADPAEMLAALTEPRPTTCTTGTSRTSGDADESVTS